MRYYLLSLLLIALTACNPQGNKNGGSKGFVITGEIKGVPDQKIYLKVNGGEQAEVQEFEPSEIINGQFEFKGKLINPPALVSLSFEDTRVKLWKTFVVDNSDMDLSVWEQKAEEGNSSFIDARLAGSSSHNSYVKHIDKLQEISKEVKMFAFIYRTLGNNGELPMEEWSEEDLAQLARMEKLDKEAQTNRNNYLIDAVNNGDDLVKVFAVAELFHWGISPFNSFELCEEAYDKLDPNFRLSEVRKYYSSEILRKSEQARLASEVTVGNAFKDFTQNDQHGKPVTASDGLKSNKYLFLDFWASWCGPCRKENPNLLKAYNKYHDKGFEVLAISIDHDKEAWLKAIEKDGMPWTQVSDLEGPDNVVAKLYAVTGIPSSFLIDRDEGIIVATDLRGKDLDKKLEELLNK